MGFLGLFSRPDITHPELGRLRWRHGLWIGSLNGLEIRLHGGKSGPSESDEARLSEAIANLAKLKQSVAPKVFEHFEAYKDANSSGLILGTDEPFPDIGEPSAVWEHTFEHVLRVGPYADASEVELCFTVAWDIEHTLGALFKGGELVELCSSILLPRA